MYLRTLTLHGFKSFAHPTSVEFCQGFNVIVGPNGSGKSNLVDALRWVLGGRRGGHQVLFHGSSKYHPVGMASVELVFEGDRIPPFRVEKRAFASGEVEYFFQGRRIRFLDLRRELTKLGLLLHRLEVGFVTNHDLHTIANLSPLERLRWLEEASGVLEMRARLARLSRILQDVAEKRGRFRERLQEVAFQRARIEEWAKREEEYLNRERRWQGAQRVYFVKLLEKLRADFVRLSEEESLCKRELEHLSAQKSYLALETEERHFLAFRKALSSLREEVERGKQSVAEKERELYQLLTEMRKREEMYITLEAQGRDLLEEVYRLEREKALFQTPPGASSKLERIEKRITCFLEEKRKELRFLKEEELKLRETFVRLEVTLKSVEHELKRLLVSLEKLREDIGELEGLLADSAKRAEECKAQREILRQRREDLVHHLVRTKEALLRVHAKLKKVGVWDPSGSAFEEMHAALSAEEWPNQAIHALLGLLRGVQVLEGEHIPEECEGWMVPRAFLPPSFPGWAVRRREEILSYLWKGEEPEKNLVALDGSLVLLKSGFFLFPQHIVLRARFLESWKRREALFRRQVQELEKAVQDITMKEEALERQGRTMELRAIQWQERLSQKREVQREVEEKFAALSAEHLELTERLKETGEKLRALAVRRDTLEKALNRGERILRRIQEKKREEEAERRRYERFLWEVQRVRKEIVSVLGKMRENTKVFYLLCERLVHCGQELGELLQVVEERAALLRDQEEKEKLFEKSIEAKRQTERSLERQREKWLKERERLRFAREKLREEIERVEGMVATLEGELSPEFQAMDLCELEGFLKEEEEALASMSVRRGAMEEYRELKSREEELRQRDTFFDELLTLALGELRRLEEGIKRQFLVFLNEAKQAFARYFERIFQGGSASFVVRDGVHLEVQIPGKRTQDIALLSSGERTLVALCFLCACFEAGGARMCFFDEIDANLDHTNSLLLAQVLKEFSVSRQVVVVTHKEEVMEAAERILGVTMGEPGVSQVLLCEGFVQRGFLRGGA